MPQLASGIFTNQGALQKALKWGKEHCIQEENDEKIILPMMAFVRQVPINPKYTERRYFTMTLPAFERAFLALPDDERHFDEVVIDGPCKLFADLEMQMKQEYLGEFRCKDFAELRQKLEDAAAAYIGYVVAFHKREHQITVEPIVLTAHKESKWSMHVIFDGGVWRDRQHCQHFMAGFVKREEIRNPIFRKSPHGMIDMGVYDANHPLRTYRSSKPDEPHRLLLGPGESLDDEPNLPFLRKSLITCIKASIVDESTDADDDAYNALLNGTTTAAVGTIDENAANNSTKTAISSNMGPRYKDVYVSSMFLRLHVTDPDMIGLKYISAPGYSSNKLLNPARLRNAVSTTRYFDTIVELMPAAGDGSEEHAMAVDGETEADGGDAKQAAAAVTSTPIVARTVGRGLTPELIRFFSRCFKPFDPYSFKVDSLSCMVLIACKSRHCSISNREHSSNHIYLIVDLYRQLWQQRCHNENCSSSIAGAVDLWNPLPPDVGAACRQCAEQWQETLPMLAAWCGLQQRQQQQKKQRE